MLTDILLQRLFSNDNKKFSNTLLNKSMFNCTRHLVNFLEIDNLNIYFRSQLNKNSLTTFLLRWLLQDQNKVNTIQNDILEFQHSNLRTVFFICQLRCHKNHTKHVLGLLVGSIVTTVDAMQNLLFEANGFKTNADLEDREGGSQEKNLMPKGKD